MKDQKFQDPDSDSDSDYRVSHLKKARKKIKEGKNNTVKLNRHQNSDFSRFNKQVRATNNVIRSDEPALQDQSTSGDSKEFYIRNNKQKPGNFSNIKRSHIVKQNFIKYSRDYDLRHDDKKGTVHSLSNRQLYRSREEKNGRLLKSSVYDFEKGPKPSNGLASKVNPKNSSRNKGNPSPLQISNNNVNPSADSETDLVWGRHSAQAILESGRPIHRIWCTSELKSSSKFLQLLKKTKKSNVLVEEVTWARLSQLTGGGVHQGIALQIAAVEALDLDKLIEACYQLEERPLLMAVEGLTDPHNLGAIIRSAEALGAHGLILPQRRNAGLTGSVAKVAAGALEHLPVARVINLNRSLGTLKEKGYRIIGLAEEGDINLMEADLTGPLVVVTGSEGSGLSLLTRRHCDQLVRIPLRGITPSLNAAVASALMLYEIARRSWMQGLGSQSPAPKLLRPRIKSNNIIKTKKMLLANGENTSSLPQIEELQKVSRKTNNERSKLFGNLKEDGNFNPRDTKLVNFENQKQAPNIVSPLPYYLSPNSEL
uniref:tRNA/rRNA methyltransferase (SpoU):RNA methyltransferase TrmH n=1 Tax=Paulinella micropora TaxID=1928728 RepID=A0A1L5YBF5_9EUKA|nr:tRNA/rRNA methyltransferase (SpoU):RNA methyltransferase TrmH [Paulinella micropora]